MTLGNDNEGNKDKIYTDDDTRNYQLAFLTHIISHFLARALKHTLQTPNSLLYAPTLPHNLHLL